MAILAGIVSQVLEDYFGHIGPFQGAIALTVLALVLVLSWEENYGENNNIEERRSSLYDQFFEAWKTTLSKSHIWKIGMTQALSEGAMYTVSFCVVGLGLLNLLKFGFLNFLFLIFASLCSCGSQHCFRWTRRGEFQPGAYFPQ